jgi:hypothetical protein
MDSLLFLLLLPIISLLPLPQFPLFPFQRPCVVGAVCQIGWEGEKWKWKGGWLINFHVPSHSLNLPGGKEELVIPSSYISLLAKCEEWVFFFLLHFLL